VRVHTRERAYTHTIQKLENAKAVTVIPVLLPILHEIFICTIAGFGPICEKHVEEACFRWVV
jgi:hypothetical protein